MRSRATVSGRVSHSVLALIVVWGASAAAVSPAHAQLIGVGWSGLDSAAYTIDQNTGSGGFLGYTGFDSLNSLARDSLGTLYSVADSVLGQELITIHPSTGQGTSLATLGVSDIRAIAFSPTDALYAVVAGMKLVTVDTTTGQATSITDNMGASFVQGLAFSPGGDLYGWDAAVGLVTIDPVSGMASVVNAAAGGGGLVQTLAFRPDGQLYGARDALYEIDPATGELTLIGTGSYLDVRGLEVIPEPRAGFLLVVAITMGLRRRTRG